MAGTPRRRFISKVSQHGAAVGSHAALAALSRRADSRLVERRNQHPGDEPGIHQSAVAGAADGVQLRDTQRSGRARRLEIHSSRIFPPHGRGSNTVDGERPAIRRQHARRSAGFDRAGISGIYGDHHHSKGRGQFQLRVAGGASKEFRPPFHRILERHDLGAHSARGRSGTVGVRGTQPARTMAARRCAACGDLERLGPGRALRHRHHRVHVHVLVHPQHSRGVSRRPHRRRDHTGIIWALGRQGIHGFHSLFLFKWWPSTPASPSS